MRRILDSEGCAFDFVFVVGDERTDEDMFDIIPGHECFSCTVGQKISRAQYYLDEPEEVVQVLTALTRVTTDSGGVLSSTTNTGA